MAIKVEHQSSIEVKDLESQVQAAIECLPIEHLRGFSRIRFVDRIEDSRLPQDLLKGLPALYRPKQPGHASAFGDVALMVLQPQDLNWFKRLAAKAQLKALIAQSVMSLVAQHYLVTVSSKKKKGPEIERAVREYVERYFKVWRGRQSGWRARLFRPLVPYLEKWQKSARKYQLEQARKKAGK